MPGQEMVRFSQCLSMTALQLSDPFLTTRMPLLRRILLVTLVATTACASGPEIRKLGDYPYLQPLFTLPQNQRTPSEMTVNLRNPAYVAALFVVPGRGAVVVFPSDTVADLRIETGQHTIPLHFRETAYNRDSMYAALRRQAQGRGNPPPNPTPYP